MSNPLTFMNNFFQLNVECIQIIQRMRTANDQLVEDPTLVDRYFALTGMGPGVPRTDITKTDVENAQTTFQQLFYTLDNATPAWKSYMYKMLP